MPPYPVTQRADQQTPFPLLWPAAISSCPEGTAFHIAPPKLLCLLLSISPQLRHLTLYLSKTLAPPFILQFIAEADEDQGSATGPQEQQGQLEGPPAGGEDQQGQGLAGIIVFNALCALCCASPPVPVFVVCSCFTKKTSTGEAPKFR